MAETKTNIGLNVSLPQSLDTIIENVLGPTSETLGQDLNTLYKKGTDKIFRKSMQKIDNPTDNKTANLRVARDVFFNGAFTDSDITAEYFGGILASSRTKDGKDDSGIFYLDIVKSLSSEQLKTHYIVYNMFHQLLQTEPPHRDFGMANNAELSNFKIFVPSFDLVTKNFNELGYLLFGLHSKKLIENFHSHNIKLKNNKILPIIEINPTTLGVQLFSVAYNKFDSWEEFSTIEFKDWEDIRIPKNFSSNKDILLKKLKIPEDQIVNESN